MTQTTITAEVHETFDVHRHFAPQVALDLVASLNDVANTPCLIFAKVLGPQSELHSRGGADVMRQLASNSVDVLKRDDDSLLRRKINS